MYFHACTYEMDSLTHLQDLITTYIGEHYYIINNTHQPAKVRIKSLDVLENVIICAYMKVGINFFNLVGPIIPCFFTFVNSISYFTG